MELPKRPDSREFVLRVKRTPFAFVESFEVLPESGHNEDAFRNHARAASSVMMRIFLYRALLFDESPFDRATTQNLYDQTWRQIHYRTQSAEMYEHVNGTVFPGVRS